MCILLYIKNDVHTYISSSTLVGCSPFSRNGSVLVILYWLPDCDYQTFAQVVAMLDLSGQLVGVTIWGDILLYPLLSS